MKVHLCDYLACENVGEPSNGVTSLHEIIVGKFISVIRIHRQFDWVAKCKRSYTQATGRTFIRHEKLEKCVSGFQSHRLIGEF